MAPTAKKALKIRRALGAAARLPARVSGGRGSGRNHFAPLPGEQPMVLLRVQVLGCKGLSGNKGKNGLCDPFVMVSLLNTRYHTPVSRRSTSPTFVAKDATFDFPIYLSLADRLGVIELVVWDKDMLRKEYLGEVALPLEDWFLEGNAYGFNDPSNNSSSVNLVSTRASTHVSGSVQVKFGFVRLPGLHALSDFDKVFKELVKRSRPSLVSAPPTEGIGTLRSHLTGPAYEDDGGISSDEGEGNTDDDDEEGPSSSQIPRLTILAPERPTEYTETAPPTPADTPATPAPIVEPKTPSTAGTPSTSRTSQVFKIPRLYNRRQTLTDTTLYSKSMSSSPPSSPSTPSIPSSSSLSAHRRSASAGPTPDHRGKKFRKHWSNKRKDYNLSSANDIVGIVMLEIQGANDLPRFKNMTRTGWDMDPFVVISFGKKVFRTRVIRHSRNPVWDEKLLFHVRRYETSFKVQLTVLDWDKLSSNDHVGDASFDVAELLADAPQRDPNTGLYAADEDGGHPMKEFRLPLSTDKEMPWEAIHNSSITLRAKYQPYDALRQRFWRQYLKQYDTDDRGTLSHLELTSMLDSLGSTLSRETIDSFFIRHGKKPRDDELSIDEAIQCLETELGRPTSEKKRIDPDRSFPDSSISVTPLNLAEDSSHKPFLGELDFSGPPFSALHMDDYPVEVLSKAAAPTPYLTEMNEQPLEDVAEHNALTPRPGGSSPRRVERQPSSSSSEAEDSSGSNGAESGSPPEEFFERVIDVKNCPLCHRPRLNSKAEVDIITHLAVCASQDWAKVNRIVVGNFVTASQAQRKWYTKVLSKVSSGDYRLGANSANIIVQNRVTGQLEEEKMQVYVRLGIRLLYKGARSRMEGARARRLLKSLSIKQGLKYDSPESARDILAFIEFHKLKVDEFLDPVSSFKSFNQFFYRKLKPSARPIEHPDDPHRLVSAADCRLMVFETSNEATRLWIKGREFTVARLLGNAYRDVTDRYTGGALAIFRLAPQDYHRFHSPIDGTIGPMTYISGEYYTVNPQAIRSALDVYGENARKIVPIDSPQFGRVMAVCIGAMMVGSIQTTVNEGDQVVRGQELGYFAFGGSTVVVLFEKGTVQWDEDLLINGRACLETLVRVGMGIGHSRRHLSTHSSKHNIP